MCNDEVIHHLHVSATLCCDLELKHGQSIYSLLKTCAGYEGNDL